jgi:hypothetical protein
LDVTSENTARILTFLPVEHPLKPLALGGDTRLVWLGAEAGRQLVLKLQTGRYKVEYWGKDCASPVGVEVATGPTLVLSPPPERPLVALIESLA